MKRTASLSATLFLLTLPVSAQTVYGDAVERNGCNTSTTLDLKVQPLQPIAYLPSSQNLFMMDAETLAYDQWFIEDTEPGFGGCAYIRWNGPDHFEDPGTATLNFDFWVLTAGDYILRMNVKHDDPDSSMENDCWARMDDDPWEKLVNNYGAPSVGVWNWNSVWENTGQKPSYTLAAGFHSFKVSARSQNFQIDRIAIMPQSVFGTSTTIPESRKTYARPVIGTTMIVRLVDECNQTGMSSGAVAAWMVNLNGGPNYPCGIVKKGREYMIGLSPAPIMGGPNQVWNAAGLTWSVPIPNDPAYVGIQVFSQAALVQPGRVEMTNALDFVIGDF